MPSRRNGRTCWYRHVLLTTDLSDGSRDALRLAFDYSLPNEDKEQYLADERALAARACPGSLGRWSWAGSSR